MSGIAESTVSLLSTVGELGIFGLKAVRESIRPPFEGAEIIHQLYEIGWRSGPLVMVSGFAFGVVLAMETGASMARFGAEAMIPQAVSMGLFTDIGPVVTGLLVSGRIGAGIGAQLAGMKVTEQIDALESIAVDSFKYLVVTRIAACVIALPILTLLLNYSGIAGGMLAEMFARQVSMHQFLNEAFGPMGWSDYIPPTIQTLVFGFIIGTVSCFLGYTASNGAVGVGRASTRSVVFSSMLLILSEVILEKIILFWFS
ncbi:MAG TPA: ABC transporter permease [Bryobacteraceae bacterium]|nr:ABC transporter permease [Bryobacteraceae bacterium]